MKPFCCAILLVSLLIVGCAQSRSYELSVTNQSDEPITIWLTKDGPPEEDGWKPPLQVAVEHLDTNEPLSGVVVPPGKVATTGKITGHFDPHTHAVLRVYYGASTLAQVLAIDKRSLHRLEIPLQEGHSVFQVSDRGGIVHADLLPPPPAKP